MVKLEGSCIPYVWLMTQLLHCFKEREIRNCTIMRMCFARKTICISGPWAKERSWFLTGSLMCSYSKLSACQPYLRLPTCSVAWRWEKQVTRLVLSKGGPRPVIAPLAQTAGFPHADRGALGRPLEIPALPLSLL